MKTANKTSKGSPSRYAGSIPAGAEDITRIKESASKNELVVVIGTGVSIALTNGKIPTLSWKGLIQNGFEYALKKALITPSQLSIWIPHLDSPDIADLLGAAEFITHKLSSPNDDLYARWLEINFKHVRATNEDMKQALRTLQNAGVPLCTLNYDRLLEEVTGLNTVNISDTPRVTEWMRRESAGILHLHGSWDVPASCILGLRDYETTRSNDLRDLIQRSLGSFKRLLFVGCGDTFADPNFSCLISWLRAKMKSASPQH